MLSLHPFVKFPSAAPASLDPTQALPVELLERILSHVDTGKALLAAAGVSRQWREAATAPALVDPQLRKLRFTADQVAAMDATARWRGLCHRVSIDDSLARGRYRRQPLCEAGAPITALAFDAQGTRAVAGAADGSVRVWELAADRPAASITLSTSPLPAHSYAGFDRLELNAPGTHVLATHGRSSQLWAISNPGAVTTLHGQATFAPSGARLVVAGGDGRVWLRDLQRGRRALVGRGSPAANLAVAPRGRRVAVGCDDGVTQVWSLGTLPSAGFRLQNRVPTRDSARAEFSATGSHLLTQTWGWEGGTAEVWKLEAPVQRLDLMRNNSPLAAAAFDPSGLWLLTGAHDGTVRRWNLATPEQPLAVFETPFTRIHSALLSAGTLYGLVTTATPHPCPQAVLFDSSTDGAPSIVSPRGASHGNGCEQASFNAHGTLLLTQQHGYGGGQSPFDGTLVSSIAAPSAYVNLDASGGRLTRALFDPSGSRVLAGGEDGAVALFDLDFSAPVASDTQAVAAGRMLPMPATSLQERAQAAITPCLALPMIAGVLAVCAASPVLRHLPMLGDAPRHKVTSCVAGALICAGLSIVSAPLMVASFAFPRTSEAAYRSLHDHLMSTARA